MRKAQGMSLNVIIVAVIALIILVVLVLIFTGRSKMFSKGTGDTSAQYGADKCKIPGTDRECEMGGRQACEQKGGVYSEGPYEDCFGTGCCTR